MAVRVVHGWKCFAGCVRARGWGDRIVLGARRVRMFGAGAGGGGERPSLLSCCFFRPESHFAAEAWGCVPAWSPSNAAPPLLALGQPLLAASRTWLPALCQAPGSNSCSILRTRWAPHGQCCDPDIKPGLLLPGAWGQISQSCSRSGTNFRVACESQGTPALPERLTCPPSCAMTAPKHT